MPPRSITNGVCIRHEVHHRPCTLLSLQLHPPAFALHLGFNSSDNQKVYKMQHAGSHVDTLQSCKVPVNSSSARHVSRVSRGCRLVRVTAQRDSSSEDVPSKANALSSTVKRKQKQLADLLQDMGMEALEDRLQSATASPLRPPHRFARLIQVPGD